MPLPKRRRVAPTDDWQQLRMLVGSPEQETYELPRPIVLYGQTPAERARHTGAAERTLRRKADRFDAQGMASLFDAEEVAADDRRAVPAAIRRAIFELKVEHPAFRPHELAEICRLRYDCRVSHHTSRRLLAQHPLLARTSRRYPPYHQILDPAERRLANVRLSFEGWNVKSVALYLETTRTRVYETPRRWLDEGAAGMDEPAACPEGAGARSRAPRQARLVPDEAEG